MTKMLKMTSAEKSTVRYMQTTKALSSCNSASRNIRDRAIQPHFGQPPIGNQSGFTLVAVMLVVMIVSIMAVGSMELGHVSEKSAGISIQRSRAFQAADGGAAIAESNLKDRLGIRIYADATASEGIFSTGSYTQKWWRNASYDGEIIVDEDAILGVHTSPRHIFEEVGQYATDGGTGIVGLDLGSAQYGSRSRSGREVVVYRIESHGAGSIDGVQSVIETVYLSSF